MQERGHFEKSILEMRITDSLSLWQRFPDSPAILDEMNKVLGEASDESIELKVRKEALRTPGKFMRSDASHNYGRIEGGAFVIDIPSNKAKLKGMPRVSLRMGSIKGENFLMLESSIEKVFGFLRPEDIISFSIEK